MMIRLVDVYKTRGASSFLYELMRQRSVEDDPHVNISHRRLPPREEHEAFLESHPYRCWLIIQTDIPGGWENAGTVLATERNEIGIVLARSHRGRGIGKQAVQQLMRDYEPLPAVPSFRLGQWQANINPANAASIRLFTGLGMRHISNTYELQK